MESMVGEMSKKSSPEATLEYPPDESELPDDDVLEEFEAEGEPEARALGAAPARAASARASSGESLTPPRSTYSTSTRVRRARAWSCSAATRSAVGCTRSIGISGNLLRGTECVSETARRYLWPSAVKRRICGTMPAGGLGMARASICPPPGGLKMRAAWMTLS